MKYKFYSEVYLSEESKEISTFLNICLVLQIKLYTKYNPNEMPLEAQKIKEKILTLNNHGLFFFGIWLFLSFSQ